MNLTHKDLDICLFVYMALVYLWHYMVCVQLFVWQDLIERGPPG